MDEMSARHHDQASGYASWWAAETVARRRSPRTRTWRIVVALPTLLFACLIYSWLTLPDVRALRSVNPERTAFMDLRRTEARREGMAVREARRWMPYSRIAPSLKQAVLVAEDAAFWSHDGVDYGELRASLVRTLREGVLPRGASTVTQQLAKNLYLSPSRSPYRKLVELLITRRLEAELSKTRILELYLNVVEWGDGIWGADAAARAHFGRPASDLSSSQSALLAGALINARVYSPTAPNRRLLARQRIILNRMSRPAGPSLPARVEEIEDEEEGDGAVSGSVAAADEAAEVQAQPPASEVGGLDERFAEPVSSPPPADGSSGGDVPPAGP
jgi:monofunctional biosynthetic peptidoglycan transglycosylase